MQPINSAGFLFVSQLRLTSRVVKLRANDDLRVTLLNKLQGAFEIANRKNLTVIFIGHLFEKQRESDIRLLSGLLTLMAAAKNKPIVLANAEDLKKTSNELLDDVSLTIIAASQLATVITEPGIIATITHAGQETDCWAAPFGSIDPEQVFARNTLCVMHDIMSQPCTTLANVCQVINGYSLINRSEGEADGTQWLFPASASRLTAGEKDNVPSVSSWSPGEPAKQYVLEYTADVYTEETDNDDDHVSPIAALPKSLFVELLKEELNGDLEIDDDMAFKSDIEALMLEQEVAEPIKLMLLDLIKRSQVKDKK